MLSGEAFVWWLKPVRRRFCGAKAMRDSGFAEGQKLAKRCFGLAFALRLPCEHADQAAGQKQAAGGELVQVAHHLRIVGDEVAQPQHDGLEQRDVARA